MSIDEQIVVIANGSHTTKIGFGGEEQPRCVFPIMVACFLEVDRKKDVYHRDYHVGDYGWNLRHVLPLHYPIERGEITNWDAMSMIWSHSIFNELRVNPQEYTSS